MRIGKRDGEIKFLDPYKALTPFSPLPVHFKILRDFGNSCPFGLKISENLGNLASDDQM